MDKQLEERIRQRAYELWMQNGCLPDRAEEYWYQAEQEILGDASSQQAAGLERGIPDEIGSAPLPEEEDTSLGGGEQTSMDVSPAPLGMTSQTADELMPSVDESPIAPAAAKTRRKRTTPSAAGGEGGDAAPEPPKRRRTIRTP